MSAVLVLAGKEIRDGVRNRWAVAATLLLGGLALALALLGSAPVGAVNAAPLAVVAVSLSSLSVLLIPLIALLLSHETFAVEADRGTMLLLLACPVARWQVVTGKFLGHAAVLGAATTAGYGAAGLAVGLRGGSEAWPAFAALVATSALLGTNFAAIGSLVGAAARDRGTAAGAAVAVWLFFVVLYDAALLGVLVADEGHAVTAGLFDALLLLNPTDVYRMFNLTGSDAAAAVSGMAGAAERAGLGTPALLAAAAAWTLVPLAAAGFLFSRREM